MSPKELCLSLMNASSEEEVISLLTATGYWNSNEVWRFFDDNENNYSTIGNQTSRPEAALVEKIVNSIDAVLINECRVRNLDPEGPAAPRTINAAVSEFFENNPQKVNAGLVSEWSDQQRKEIAKNITVALSGATPKRGYPCITIADRGEGQTPTMFPATFMSLSKSNKLRIPFVQGKFNMGGTGALKFCGTQNLQLIVSRRNPALSTRERQLRKDDQWGFTIVRREEPSEGRKNSAYTYLAPIDAAKNPHNGEILRFPSNSLPIFPEGPGAVCSRHSAWGTLVKLYEYSVPGHRTHVLRKGGLLGPLDLLLPSPALPIRLYECRPEYGGKEASYDNTLAGLQVRLDDNKAASQEEGFPKSFQLSVDGQTLRAKIYAFRRLKGDAYRKNEGILFVINGQTHAVLTTDFFRRKTVGHAYLADSLLLIVDCSNLKPRNIEDLFMNSRDRLSWIELRSTLESLLERELAQDPMLKELREKRRREATHEDLQDTSPLENLLQSIMEHNPTLSRLFLLGERLSNPFKTRGTKETLTPYVGKRYPTYFRFKGHQYGAIVQKECHVNMRCRVSFETDASNDYFYRAIDPGTSQIAYMADNNAVSVQAYTLNLQNGMATLTVDLPNTTTVGDEVDFLCSVADPTQMQSFENRFRVKVLRAADAHGGKSTRRKPPSNETGNDRMVPTGIELPRITPVHEDEWQAQDPPFDKFSACAATYVGNGMDGGEESGTYDFFVNMDNVYLQHELKNSSIDADTSAVRFKYGMVLLSLGILHDYGSNGVGTKKETTDNGGEVSGDTAERTVFKVTRALAPMLLPLVETLGSIDSEVASRVDYSGDSA